MRVFRSKRLLLLLLAFVLISILVLNTIVSDLNYNNGINEKNVCHQLTTEDSRDRHDLNYTLIRSNPTVNTNHINHTFVNISDNLYLYSAFETIDGFIVLIGFAKNELPVSDDYNYYNYSNSYQLSDYRYFCAFNWPILVRTEAEVEYLPEGHNYYYTAIRVHCRRPKLFDSGLSINKVKLIEENISKKNKNHENNKDSDHMLESDFVAIVPNTKRTTSSDKLQDTRQDILTTDSLPSPQIVVCVRPLYGNISALNLLEFIAYYRLNGINKIVFYNSIDTNARPMSDHNKRLFELLSSIDFVEVMPFVIPNNEELRPIIHANGQLTAIHDCLYRFADYVQIHVDFDEFLMSYKYKSIRQMLSSEEMSQPSALVVPTIVFCNEFNANSSKSSDQLLISNFNRQKTVWPHEVRSKVIVMRPPMISQMGIHNVWKLAPVRSHQKSHPVVNSKPDQSLIYHYRKCCDIIQPYFANIIHFQTINDYIVRDEAMNRFIISVKRFIDSYIQIIG